MNSRVDSSDSLNKTKKVLKDATVGLLILEGITFDMCLGVGKPSA